MNDTTSFPEGKLRAAKIGIDALWLPEARHLGEKFVFYRLKNVELGSSHLSGMSRCLRR